MAIGALFLGLCYLGSFVQILLATNRLTVVYCPSRTFLSHKRVLVLIGVCCIATVGMITYSQFILPCCRIVPDPKIYSYSYLAISVSSIIFRYFIQFIVMFLTYSIVWLTFFLYPVIGIKIPQLYAATAVVLIMNCGTNSVVYLVMSKEVRYAANQLFGRVLFSDTQYLPKKPISLNQIHPLAPINTKPPIL
ncbi:hypothetical protein OSTOST_02191 [Ostertagia ostertagi]